MMSVTVKVTNINEPGNVALSSVQPRVGVALTATLTDPDGSVSGVNLAMVAVHNHRRHLC